MLLVVLKCSMYSVEAQLELGGLGCQVHQFQLGSLENRNGITVPVHAGCTYISVAMPCIPPERGLRLTLRVFKRRWMQFVGAW